MTRTEKQSELERHRVLVLATLDYKLERHTGVIVYDGSDYIKEYYEQQKVQAEKYFKSRRLDRLQQQLQRLTATLQSESDFHFSNYIKEKTGYDLHTFEELSTHVDNIIRQKQIYTEREFHDVQLMLSIYRKSAPDIEKAQTLENMVSEFFQRSLARTRSHHTEIIDRVEEDGIVRETFCSSTGPKPKHFVEKEIISPDGKRKLRVTQYGTKNSATTNVAIVFKDASGAIYGVNGICPDVKASWKDNSTIVIETKSDYVAGSRCEKVSSYDDVINIEYIVN